MERLSLDSLVVDDPKAGVFRVRRRVFSDPWLLDLERDRIFDQCWLYVGHESEIPKPGDFRTRKLAGRPVILVRGDDGQLRVLLNSCRHRGTEVCRQPAGNARTFRCFYHAWTYSNCGALVGVPGAEAYGSGFDRGQMGLASPPRVESYRGLVFASFNPKAEPLVDYLAGAKEYLDLACDYSEAGLEIVSGEQQYGLRANWKLLVENGMDGYHAVPTHQRYFNGFLVDIGVVGPEGRPRVSGTARSLGNGHAVILYDLAAGNTNILKKTAAAELETIRLCLEARLGPTRARQAMAGTGNLFIFPNLTYIDAWKALRTYYPVSPELVEVISWGLMPKDDGAELRRKRIDSLLAFLGPGGFATPDDIEALESCQRGFAAREVEWSDISRGMTSELAQHTDELQMRAFWRRWHQLMLGTATARAGTR